MQLKSFIMLLYILSKGVYEMSAVINLYEAMDGQTTRRQQRDANLTLLAEEGGKRREVCCLMAMAEVQAKGKSEEVPFTRTTSGNSTQESYRTTPSETKKSVPQFLSARKTPFLEILPTRPSALFTTGEKPFNILEQLKLDEIHDAQEQLLFNSGQKLKAVKKKKKKKKRKKRKKNKKQKPIGEQATIFWTQLTTKKPHYYYHATTTKAPKKIKYIVRKKNALKKKKKEYLNHLKHVLYPFIKFIAFFTVLNPFTLKVFLFALILPVIFGFLGFMALSFMVKPALHLIFDVKKRVDIIKRKHWREKKRRERWRYGRRPITIHKHYYKNVVLPHPPKSKPKPPIHISHEPPHLAHPPRLPPPDWPEWVRADQIDFRPKFQSQRPTEMYKPAHQRVRFRPSNQRFNPILPEVEEELEDWPFGHTQSGNFNGRKPPTFSGGHLHSGRLQFKRPPSLLINRNKIEPNGFRHKNKEEAVPLNVSEFEDAPFL